MKKIKDPIYGYISIPKEIVCTIIDTAEFQRLRYIRQTSYLPVYPAALHNRFTHSLGVYYLGSCAFDSIESTFNNLYIPGDIDIKEIRKIFTLACLLHDVGHAPFSHSGETFYLDKNGELYDKLSMLVDDSLFTKEMKEYHTKGKIAAPHEIMSVILSLTQFKDLFSASEERSLFARCITGYTYKNEDNCNKYAFYNAVISLLNSSTIDVDRLDYLIRDAFVTGYNSISIDYKRLLGGLMLFKDSNERIHLAFHKSALSVIENVIYAHDSEKKWIQNHPVILYEIFLIQHIIREVKTFYKTKTDLELFSLESLLPGKLRCNDLKMVSNVSLLCDDDIVYLSKLLDSKFCIELYARNLRRSPIWKSESEYKVILDGYIGDDAFVDLQNQLGVVEKFLQEESPSHCLDQKSMELCQQKLLEIETAGISESDKNIMKERYQLLMRWLKCFESIHNSHNIDFDFVIIPATKFESSFNKQALRKLLIYFPDSSQSYQLDKLIDLFSVKELSRHKFFYVYYTKKADSTLDIQKVGKEIAKLALD